MELRMVLMSIEL